MTKTRFSVAALGLACLLAAGACSSDDDDDGGTAGRPPALAPPRRRQMPRPLRPLPTPYRQRRAATGTSRPACAAGSPSTPRCSIPIYVANGADLTIVGIIFEGLVQPGPEGDIVNVLADTYEIAEDGLRIDFTLKQGVQFQGGYGEMTMDDVKFSIERAAGLIESVDSTSVTVVLHRARRASTSSIRTRVCWC